MFFSRVRRWAMLVLVAIALVGCKRSPTPAPTPSATMATPGIRSSSGQVVASGEVVPSQETHLGFPVSGRVETVAVNKGDRVEAGQVLIVLETDLLEAGVAQAEAALAAAQTQVALLKAGPRLEEVAAAEAQVAAAQTSVAQAEVQQTRPDLGATQAEIRAAQAQVAAAMADQLVTEEIHELTMTCVTFTWQGEEHTICPVLGPIEEQARYGFHAADAAQAAAQAQLDALLGGANAEVRVVEAGVQAAAAQRDVAQAQLETVQAGATAEEITAAEAVVSQAEAALQVARAGLDQATLRAPSAGTVTALEVGPGEALMPGQVALTLVDPSRLRVETTDLSELDVARVAVGQRASVYVEPLDVTVEGQVVRIASQAEMIGGDVVYAVVVELDEQPPGLRWGMSVEVEITTTETRAESVSRAGGDTVVASGEVAPAQEAQLNFTVLGRVETVTVAEGDTVAAGGVLAMLETTLLEAQVAQAQAAVAAAQAQLPVVKAGPRPGEVAGAEAQLAAAEAAVVQAVAQRDQVIAGATEEAIATARAQLAAAEAEEKAALIACDEMPEQGLRDWQEEEIILRLRAATLGREAAEALLALAEKNAWFQVRAAEAAIRTAEAQRDVAQAQLALVQAEVTVEEIAVAEGAVAQAEAALQAARAALDQATLRAPFAGAVTALEVSPGETVMPGQAVLTLAELHHLQAETTDLSERDVVQVSVGQQATVYVEALGVEIGGQVVDIAPQANTVGGDVVYAVTIELDEQPPGLRWGMSVEVEIKVH